MNNRFRFRATFSVSYYDENGNDKDIKLTIYDVAVYSGGEIGFSAQQIETIINVLKLPEIEEDTIWQFINDNYATSSYEWFVCDNAIIEQCTGLKDKNGNLIYIGDKIKCGNGLFNTATVKYENGENFIDGIYPFNLYHDCGDECHCQLRDFPEYACEIIGNIHEQSEQKDK